MSNNNRNSYNIVFSATKGSFRDVYVTNQDGNKSFRISFYRDNKEPFSVVPVDLTGTIPKFGQF